MNVKDINDWVIEVSVSVSVQSVQGLPKMLLKMLRTRVNDTICDSKRVTTCAYVMPTILQLIISLIDII